MWHGPISPSFCSPRKSLFVLSPRLLQQAFVKALIGLGTRAGRESAAALPNSCAVGRSVLTSAAATNGRSSSSSSSSGDVTDVVVGVTGGIFSNRLLSGVERFCVVSMSWLAHRKPALVGHDPKVAIESRDCAL